MTEREMRKKVARLIIEIEKPFSLIDLFYTCRAMQIVDEDLILEVLDDLCDSGIVSYAEIKDNCWAYAPSA